jgi:probable rRNA maturation factor
LLFDIRLRFSEMQLTSKRVSFSFQTKPFFLPKRKKLKSFIEQIFKKEKKKLKELNYIFCSDDYLLKINKDFLQHDFYTDTITFDFSETEEIHGEIYISIDRVRENCKIYNVSLQCEIHRVIFHGILHLCGFDDSSVMGRRKMTEKENDYLSQYFSLFPRGTFPR